MEFLFFLDHARAMFGPYLDHVWPSFTTSPAKAPKFLRLGKHYLRYMSMVFLLFGTIFWPCLDHVWTIFGLALVPDQIDL